MATTDDLVLQGWFDEDLVTGAAALSVSASSVSAISGALTTAIRMVSGLAALCAVTATLSTSITPTAALASQASVTAALTTSTAGALPQFDAPSLYGLPYYGESSSSFTHVVGSNSNRYLFVILGRGTGYGILPTSVTFNGTALSLISDAVNGGWGTEAVVYGLLAPASGSGTVAVNWGTQTRGGIAAVSAFNVDQTTPLGTAVASISGSATVASNALGVVLDVFDTDSGNAYPIAPGSGQFAIANFIGSDTGGNAAQGIGISSKPGATSVTMSWTGAHTAAQVAVPINAPSVSGMAAGLAGASAVTASLTTGIRLAASPAAAASVTAALTTGIPLTVGSSGTNLLPTGWNEFDASAWIKSGTTVTVDAATAPDGTVSADRVAMPATGGTFALQSVTLSSGVTYTFSLWAKVVSLTNPKFCLNLWDGSGSTILAESEFTATDTNWHQYSIQYTPVSTAAYYVGIDNGLSFASNVVDIYAWGAKLETGAVATSYLQGLSAAASLTASLTTAIKLTAAPAGVSAVSASLSTAIQLAAAPAGAAAVSAALTTGIPLTSSMGGQAAITATLLAGSGLQASLAGQSAISGSLDTGIVLTAAPAAQAAVVATLTVPKPLTAAPAAATAVTASLTTGIPLTSAQAAQAAVAASLTTGIVLTASPVAQASVGAGLTTGIPLTGALAGQASITSSLTTAGNFTINAAAVSSLTGALTTQIVLVASPASASTVGGSLTTAIRLTAGAAGQASIGAQLATGIPLSSASNGQASLGASLTTAIQMTAAPAVVVSTTGALTTAIRLQASPQATATLSVLTLGSSILAGEPRFILKRPRARVFTVQRKQTRAFTAARKVARPFTVIKTMSNRRFESKDPTEKVKLTFDFSPDLASGVTLTGTITVALTLAYGTDPAVNLTQNGSATFNATATQVIVPVQAGLDGNDYRVSVQVGTTDALTYLELDGVLPVRS